MGKPIQLTTRPLKKKEESLLTLMLGPSCVEYESKCPAGCGWNIKATLRASQTSNSYRPRGIYLMESSDGSHCCRHSRIEPLQATATEWLTEHLAGCADADGREVKQPKRRGPGKHSRFTDFGWIH